MTRIPITGIGLVAPAAIGIEAFRKLLAGEAKAVATIERFDTTGLKAHRAALVSDFKPKDFIAPMKLRRMNMLSRYAVAAARMAVDDGGVQLGVDTGVAVGTCFGPVQTSVDYMQEYVEKGASLAPPQLFAESVANAPGSHIAIEHDLRGFNLTVTQRESSALSAAMYAASQIVKGVVPAAMIGGVEEINEMVFSVLDSLGALAHDEGGREEKARPFDLHRNGMIMGEGGAILIAEARPSREPYGHLAGFGMARDTTASISDWGHGADSVATAMRAAIDDAGLTRDDIDAVYASANGTKKGDALEAAALHALFEGSLPPVVATKGMFGEYTAAGALQLVAALLALRDQTLHDSAGFETIDPELNLTPHRGPQKANLRNILVNSLSAGGGIVCAVVSRDPA